MSAHRVNKLIPVAVICIMLSHVKASGTTCHVHDAQQMHVTR